MNHAYWYATRGTGVVALVLLTAVVAIGIAGSLRVRAERWPRFAVIGLHRNVTLLTLVFLGVHIVTTVLDSFTPIRLIDAFVPFVGRYRPVWLGLGAVAFDLLLALTVSSALRSRIGHRAWRALHWLAYVSWPVALTHALGTGSDARFGWLQASAIVCVLAVVSALALRLAGSPAPAASRAMAGAAAVAVVLGGAAWYSSGPGARGWAARAGTPSSALGATKLYAAAAAQAAPRTQTVSDVPTAPFAATLAGRLTTTNEPSGLVRIDIRGRTHGAVAGRLWIRVQGTPIDNGGVAMTASGVRFGTTTDPNLYAGSIRTLSRTELVAALRDANGRRLELDVQLTFDHATSTVTGTLRAFAGEGHSQ